MGAPATESVQGPAGPKPPRAYRSPVAWLVLLGVLAAGLAVDLSTKAWSFSEIANDPVMLDRKVLLADPNYDPIPRHPGRRALPWNLLDFRLVINRGAVFGIGTDKRFLFIVFTIAALSAGLYIFARRTNSRQRLAHVALALILAGGIGNLYDRIVYGVVRDFMHMLPRRHLPFGWRWGPGGSDELFPWVFNVADVMLLTGMALLMIHINRIEKTRKHAAATEQVESTGKDRGDEPAGAGA